MTEWEAIEETFARLRDFVLNDLDHLVRQKEGGQFAVVTLVLAACDALGRLYYGRDTGARVFERCLPEEWKPVAETLYNALRHGFVHGYEAKSVVADGTRVSFEVAWKGERHLTFPDESRSVLCIVAPTLVDELRDAFNSIEVELRGDATARDEFLQRDRKDRVNKIDGRDAESWMDAVSSARVVPRPAPGPEGPAGPSGGADGDIGEGATGPKGPH
jgi:hypothetical protein